MTNPAPKPAPKAATAPAPAAAAPAPAASGFKLETGFDIPAAQRIGGGQSSNWPFKDMQPGQSFLVPVNVPDTIKGDDERATAFKEQARKVSNRVSGAIRRFKNSHAGTDFAIRTVNDETLGKGVRVWRVEANA